MWAANSKKISKKLKTKIIYIYIYKDWNYVFYKLFLKVVCIRLNRFSIQSTWSANKEPNNTQMHVASNSWSLIRGHVLPPSLPDVLIQGCYVQLAFIRPYSWHKLISLKMTEWICNIGRVIIALLGLRKSLGGNKKGIS